MSYVADTMLWTFYDEDKPIAAIQAWLAAEDKGQLVEVAAQTGGHKAAQCEWWCGAFNYLDIPAFLAVVFAQEWENPENVCVCIQNEHDDIPTIYYHPKATSGQRQMDADADVVYTVPVSYADGTMANVSLTPRQLRSGYVQIADGYDHVIAQPADQWIANAIPPEAPNGGK